MKNHNRAGSAKDSCLGEIRRQFEYKCKKYGRELVKVGRFYPSTKKCSNCGNVKDMMPLSERVYKCEECGLVMDRDFNASVNVEDEAKRIVGMWRAEVKTVTSEDEVDQMNQDV